MPVERITLIRPNMGDYRSSDAMAPLALGILAARTPQEIAIIFYDDRTEEIPCDDSPDLVAMSVETFTARRAYLLADRYRERGIPVVLGGYHPTAVPDEALRHADAVVCGDAEGSWEELLRDLQKGKLRTLYHGGNLRPLSDARCRRAIFTGKKYAPIEPVQFGRGCRFHCDFCAVRSFYGSSVRTRPLASLMEELQSIDPRRLLFFVDDNLFSAPLEFSCLLAALKPLKRRWCCQISSDAAKSERMLDELAEAGCILVLIGFESLSTDNLKQMGKAWNRTERSYLETVRRFHERGIAVYGTFIFGYDYDTAETIQAAVEFALEAKLELANFNPLTPTPGTPFYARLAAEGRLLRPRWWLDPGYRYGDPIFAPRRLDPEEFARRCFAAKRAFYSWRSIARRVLRSPAGFAWRRTGPIALGNIISRREVLRKQCRPLGI